MLRGPNDAVPRERGGVLVRFAEGDDGPVLGFIPESVAVRLAALGSLVPVPGAAPPVLGIALADGAVVTVLRLGDADPETVSHHPEDEWPVPGARRAIVCKAFGIDVALTGGVVVATGLFDAAPGGDGIVWRGQMVPALDVCALYAQAEALTWTERAVTGRPRGTSRPVSQPYENIAKTDDGEGRGTWLPFAPDESRRTR
jgi:hypothetical protein